MAIELDSANAYVRSLWQYLAPAEMEQTRLPGEGFWEARKEWLLEAKGSIRQIDSRGLRVDSGTRFDGRAFLKIQQSGPGRPSAG